MQMLVFHGLSTMPMWFFRVDDLEIDVLMNPINVPIHFVLLLLNEMLKRKFIYTVRLPDSSYDFLSTSDDVTGIFIIFTALSSPSRIHVHVHVHVHVQI